ncbi:MAG: GntR family transcriptional regulator [Microbacterium sp.]
MPAWGARRSSSGAIALIVTAALPHMERSIVSHAQPSSALQLAWDDALRGGVLSTACLAVATLWLIVVLLTSQALWGAALEGASAPTPMSVAGLAMVALSQVFPTQGFALRARLRYGRGDRMIVIDPASPVPPFEQLRSQIVAEIAADELVPGERLPTVRRLAEDLGVAPGTVARAYRGHSRPPGSSRREDATARSSPRTVTATG